MELALITLVDRMKKRPLGLDDDNGISVKGIRLLMPEVVKLEKGILYVAEIPPEHIEYSEQSCVIFMCEPVTTPYCALFLNNQADVFSILNELLSIFELFTDYERRAQNIIYKQKGLQALILLCSEIFGNPAYLVDSGFKVLAIDDTPMYSEISAIWKRLVSYRYLSYDIVTGLRRSDELTLMESYSRAVIVDSNYFNNLFINYNLRDNGRIRGHFFVVGYVKRITQGDVAYANHMGKMVLLAMSMDSNYTPTRGNDYENFLYHMLTGTLKETSEIKRQLEPLGWELESKYLVFRLQPHTEDELLREALCSRLETIKSGKPLLYEEGIVVVFPIGVSDSTEYIEGRLRTIIAEDRGVGGLSDEFDGFHRLAMHYEQAKAAIILGNKSPGTLNVYRKYALTHILMMAGNNMNLEIVCEKATFRLRDHDKVHGTDYLKTLDVFLNNERSIVSTSEELHIHRNTLMYRIGRVRELLGLDLDDNIIRQRLALSIGVLKYLDARQQDVRVTKVLR